MSDDFIEKVTAGTPEEVKEALAQNPDLARAVDSSGVSAILLAVYHGRAEIAKILVDSGGDLDIFEAAAIGCDSRLRELLEGDPTLVDAYAPDGFFPLGLAAFFRRGGALKILLEAGADVNLAARNTMKVTALHAAAASGQADAVSDLLRRGADPNVRQQGGYTALHQAAHTGNFEMTKVLLDHGADANQRNDDGKTALDLALKADHDAVAEYLRGHGAL